MSKPLVLRDTSCRDSSNSRKDSKPLISGRLHMYKNERHNAATPKIVVAESALQGREGQSPVALRSVERDMVYSSTEKNPWTRLPHLMMPTRAKERLKSNEGRKAYINSPGRDAPCESKRRLHWLWLCGGRRRRARTTQHLRTSRIQYFRPESTHHRQRQRNSCSTLSEQLDRIPSRCSRPRHRSSRVFSGRSHGVFHGIKKHGNGSVYAPLTG